MAEADEDDFHWLLSRDARRYLEQAEQAGQELVTLAKNLRRNLSASRVHLVLEQIELRRRARDKFTRAEEMFFTRRLLEQATDEPIALYKSQRAAPAETVFDLCCGLGGDLIGWARRGPCRGVDRDPIAARLSRANCHVYGLSAETAVADVASMDVGECGGWHLDPDRRPAGRRTTQWDYFEPNLAVVEDLLNRQENAAIKLAPATETPPHWQARAEREWISSRRECRQQVVWFGSFAQQPGLHRATVVGRDGRHESVAGPAHATVPITTRISRFLFDPDPAILAADLSSALCSRYPLSAVDSRNGYLTGDSPLINPLLSCFEVFEVLPFDTKRLREQMRQRHIGRLEIKVRGADVDPARLAPKLKLSGENALTLIILGTLTSVRVSLARRLTQLETCKTDG